MNWKPLGRKRARIIFQRLKEIRRFATMKTANFDPFGEDNFVTVEIREKTSLWRYSYLISPLDDIIAELEDTYKLIGNDA